MSLIRHIGPMATATIQNSTLRKINMNFAFPDRYTLLRRAKRQASAALVGEGNPPSGLLSKPQPTTVDIFDPSFESSGLNEEDQTRYLMLKTDPNYALYASGALPLPPHLRIGGPNNSNGTDARFEVQHSDWLRRCPIQSRFAYCCAAARVAKKLVLLLVLPSGASSTVTGQLVSTLFSTQQVNQGRVSPTPPAAPATPPPQPTITSTTKIGSSKNPTLQFLGEARSRTVSEKPMSSTAAAAAAARAMRDAKRKAEEQKVSSDSQLPMSSDSMEPISIFLQKNFMCFVVFVPQTRSSSSMGEAPSTEELAADHDLWALLKKEGLLPNTQQRALEHPLVSVIHPETEAVIARIPTISGTEAIVSEIRQTFAKHGTQSQLGGVGDDFFLTEEDYEAH
eukprot:GILI01020312.1.p1 GENE.GILI01020312.1~~GILI01020312.1.p1  ORF type:complete len:453 (-),score=75.18 GILI01020312.1:98-1282(-)